MSNSTLAQAIKVLIIDDSIVMRSFLEKMLSSEPDIQVVATARDPYEARDKIIEFEPHVLTLDLEMPKMNGIEFLKKLMLQHPLPVIMVSAFTERGQQTTLDALNAGAVDFIMKPSGDSDTNYLNFSRELSQKIRIASRADLTKRSHHAMKPSAAISNQIVTANTLIAIGSSTGGPEALREILSQLPANMPGIVIAQHMPASYTELFARRMDECCQLHVKEAQDGDLILPGQVLIAPGDFQMRVQTSPKGYIVTCSQDEKVCGHRPSVEVLFDSVAQNFKGKSVGVMLTGMGNDGAQAMLRMRNAGAFTIGQDEETSVVYGMPKVAYECGAVQRVATLEDMPQAILESLK